MRVLLVQPDSSPENVGFNNLTMPEPLALEILAATIPDHEVRILDLRIEPHLERILKEFNPELVGVTGFTAHVPRALRVCRQVKQFSPTTYTVVGGHHASLSPADFDSQAVDFVVVGEGEITFAELVEALQEGRDYHSIPGIIYREENVQVFSGPRPLIKDLDSAPPPNRQLVANYRSHYYFRFWDAAYTVETARGCPFRCNFCSVWKFFQGRCRARSPQRVVSEVQTISGDYICFVDDNFLQDIRRAEEIYRLIKEAGLKKKYWMQARTDSIAKHPGLIARWAEIGLSTILVGFEKFREEELATLNKKTSIATNEKAIEVMHRYGVDIWGAFIIDPSWEEADFDALIAYVRGARISFPQFTILTPLPGTDFYQEKFRELRTRNYEHFDFFHSVLPTKLPIQEFYKNVARLYADTSMGVAELKKRIRRGDIPTHSFHRLRGMLSQLTNPNAYLEGAEAIS